MLELETVLRNDGKEWKNEELEKHFHATVLIEPSSNTLTASRQAGFEATVGIGGPLKVVYLKELAAYSDLQRLGTILSAETLEGD